MIKTIDKGDDCIPYSFKIPNYEICGEYLSNLSTAVEKYLVDNLEKERKILKKSIFNRDPTALSNLFAARFAKLSVDKHIRHTMEINESIRE
jgi:hypothetical protein